MSVLNGGWTGETGPDFPDLVEKFLDSITDEEWAHLAAMPPIPHWTMFVCVVGELRKELAWPLADPNHPLNPAARAAVSA